MSDTLHIIGYPHTQTTRAYSSCAYTQKVVKFCKMMTGRGRQVILYSGEENEAPCDEHVVCVTEARRQEFFGPHDESDLDRGGFDWNPASPWWSEMNSRAAGEIRKRAHPHDLLLLSQGQSQQLIADANPALTVAEFGVGYEGILNTPGSTPRNGGPAYCAYESVTHQHLVYGKWGWQNSMNGRWYDTVIPNYFDPDEFPTPDKPSSREPYLLFVGRLIALKGAHVAARIADHLDMPLVVAGSGMKEQGEGWIQADEVRVECRKLDFVGPVGWRERAELMHNAAVLLAPTMYVEPFGGVAVEAMMCGTPAVTSPWGAFNETVVPGLSGYRFHTLAQGVEAVEKAMLLDREAIRSYAHATYSLDAVAPLYEEWFDRLDSLWDKGWDWLPDRPPQGLRLLSEVAL